MQPTHSNPLKVRLYSILIPLMLLLLGSPSVQTDWSIILIQTLVTAKTPLMMKTLSWFSMKKRSIWPLDSVPMAYSSPATLKMILCSTRVLDNAHLYYTKFYFMFLLLPHIYALMLIITQLILIITQLILIITQLMPTTQVILIKCLSSLMNSLFW